MAQPKPSPGNVHAKCNSWARGNGSYSYRGELRHGISMRKKELNRKVRHSKIDLQNADYKRIVKTVGMVNFT